MKKTILISAAIFACCILQTANCFPQGTSINSTGAKADSSAMLDVSSTTKGMLVPRMLKADKLAISNPANGLLIYQTNDTTGFWYFDSAKWVQAIGPQGPAGGSSSCTPAGTGETLISFNGCLYVKNTDEPGTFNWNNAMSQCAALGTGWYLPDIIELNALYPNFDNNGSQCRGGTCPLSGFCQDKYWSSTAISASEARSEYVSTGGLGVDTKTNSLNVRCVRR